MTALGGAGIFPASVSFFEGAFFSMKFAICNETFLDWPFDKAFDFAAECGYTGIEIAPFTMATDARQISDARRAEVRRQARAAGLEVVGLHWLLAKTEGYHITTGDGDVRRRTAEYLQDLVRLCRDLGGSKMILGSPLQRNILPGVTPDEAMAHAAEVVSACLPVLEETGVTLCLEPLGPAEGNFLNTAADAVRLIETIGHPNCRLILDCKAMSSEAVPIPELVRRNISLLEHFHANDPNKQGPGFGELDFAPIFAALGEVDYRGWVSVEVFDYSPGIERLARESIENMQAALAQLAGK
jgi:sugar phosphate isomerase/epimerase